jgi:hypothetical protein
MWRTDWRVEIATDPATVWHEQPMEPIWTFRTIGWLGNTATAAGTLSTRQSARHIPTYFLLSQHTFITEKRQAPLFT